MKHLSIIAVLVSFAFICVGAIPGCTATGGFLGTGIGATSQPTSPALQLANLEDGYVLAVDGFVALRNAGTIKAGSTADNDFKEANKVAYAAIISMRQSVAAGLGIQQTDSNALAAALGAIAIAKTNGVNASTSP